MMRSWMSLGPNKSYVVFVKDVLCNKVVIKYALLSYAMWGLGYEVIFCQLTKVLL